MYRFLRLGLPTIVYPTIPAFVLYVLLVYAYLAASDEHTRSTDIQGVYEVHSRDTPVFEIALWVVSLHI